MKYKSEWEQAYLAENKDLKEYNPHEKFSELTGLSYQFAKEVAYKNIFQKDTPFIVKQLLDSNRQDLQDCYKLIKGNYNESLTKKEFYEMLRGEVI